MTIKEIHRISEIVDKYDIFFVDLWGVIHDGVESYPGVHEALAKLRQTRKRIIFLSNAPRRAYLAVEGLRKVGVSDELYENVVTSGEVLFEHVNNADNFSFMVNRNGNNHLQNGNYKRYIIIGPERDAGLLHGAAYTRVMDVLKLMKNSLILMRL
jgi:HAD superfamily hydrolase (TIGR01459 family)